MNSRRFRSTKQSVIYNIYTSQKCRFYNCFGYHGEMDKKPRAVTFDGAPAPGVINFGVGQPSQDLLPVDLIRTAAADFMAEAHPLELNYGERQGDARFRATLANFLTSTYEQPVTADSLFVTAGNSQALDFDQCLDLLLALVEIEFLLIQILSIR